MLPIAVQVLEVRLSLTSLYIPAQGQDKKQPDGNTD
jgi:hypothetical protein